MSSKQKPPTDPPTETESLVSPDPALTPRPESPLEPQEEHRVYRRVEWHAGPIPDPDSLERYDKIIPKGADRILGMAEEEQAARHEIAKLRTNGDLRVEARGQNYGAGICLTAIVGGVVLAAMDKNAIALSMIVGGLGPVVAAFLYRLYARDSPSKKTDDETTDRNTTETDEPAE